MWERQATQLAVGLVDPLTVTSAWTVHYPQMGAFAPSTVHIAKGRQSPDWGMAQAYGLSQTCPRPCPKQGRAATLKRAAVRSLCTPRTALSDLFVLDKNRFHGQALFPLFNHERGQIDGAVASGP